MAKAAKAPQFRPAAGFAPVQATPPADGITPASVDGPADEVAQLKARIAELEAEKAAAPAGLLLEPGGKYRVSLKDGPECVVECKAGEHPIEAFKKQMGVIASIHPFEVVKV